MAILIKIEMEAAKLDSPSSPPQRPVKTGEMEGMGAKHSSTKTWRIFSENGSTK